MNDAFIHLASSCYSALDRRGRLLVITYHVVDRERHGNQIERELKYLARNYKIITPSQWNGFGDARRLAMVIVDDAHHSAYNVIYPIATKLGVPITIAVPTDYVLRRKWLWFDKVAWVAAQTPFEVVVPVASRRFTLSAFNSCREFVYALKRVSPAEREARIEDLIAGSGVEVPETPVQKYAPFSMNQLTQMLAGGGVELSAHSVTHPIMTSLSPDQLKEELRRSREELEAITGAPIVSFCYPNGGPQDFDLRTRQALCDAGYRIAFTRIEGLNHPPAMDLLQLKRIHSHPRFAVFRKLASGLGDWQLARTPTAGPGNMAASPK